MGDSAYESEDAQTGNSKDRNAWWRDQLRPSGKRKWVVAHQVSLPATCKWSAEPLHRAAMNKTCRGSWLVSMAVSAWSWTACKSVCKVWEYHLCTAPKNPRSRCCLPFMVFPNHYVKANPVWMSYEDIGSVVVVSCLREACQSSSSLKLNGSAVPIAGLVAQQMMEAFEILDGS